jgi:mRNA interferase MazF
MISSQTRHYIDGFDELVSEDADDFEVSGLRVTSVVRTGRLAVVDGNMLLGAIGSISTDRLTRMRTRLAEWLLGRSP